MDVTSTEYTILFCLYLSPKALPSKQKMLHKICTTSAQRLRRWSNIVQMLYKCFVFAAIGSACWRCWPAEDVSFRPRQTVSSRTRVKSYGHVRLRIYWRRMLEVAVWWYASSRTTLCTNTSTHLRYAMAVNTVHGNVGLTLDQRRRRWTNGKPTLF